jgi:hypothetical protein
MTARDQGDGEVITGVNEFDLRAAPRHVFRNIVAQKIYPRVEGFEVDRVEGSMKGRGLVTLVIPPQPQTRRPFIVTGVVRGRAVLGAHLLIPVRREDDTALMDAASVHARLRLGEAVIEGRAEPQ